MLTDEDLHRRVVLSGDGQNIGELTRLIIDPHEFRIAALEIRVHRQVAQQLGLTRGVFRGPSVHLPIEHVQSIGDAIILSVPAARLLEDQPSAGSAREGQAPARPS